MTVIDWLRAYLLVSGSFFFISTAVAMYRFKDVYARLHAASKCLTGGSLSLLLAYMLNIEGTMAVLKVVLVAFFMLLTNPLASHALARAAYRQSALEGLDEDHYARDMQEER